MPTLTELIADLRQTRDALDRVRMQLSAHYTGRTMYPEVYPLSERAELAAQESLLYAKERSIRQAIDALEE